MADELGGKGNVAVFNAFSSALLGAILVNALSNGLGLLGVNIFWMGAIKGGLILVVLAASAVRHKGGEA